MAEFRALLRLEAETTTISASCASLTSILEECSPALLRLHRYGFEFRYL
jgi:hypothetical protein